MRLYHAFHARLRAALLSWAATRLARGLASGRLRVRWHESDDGSSARLDVRAGGSWRPVAGYLGGPGESTDEVARATAEAEMAMALPWRWR